MPPTPCEIVTSRLTLTPLVEEDAEAMVDVLGDERMYQFTGGRAPTLDELRSRYRRLAVGRSADESELWFNWIVRIGGSAVGAMQVTLATDSTSADVAWEVGVPWQGRGIAAEAATAVVDWLVALRIPVIRDSSTPTTRHRRRWPRAPDSGRPTNWSTARPCGADRHERLAAMAADLASLTGTWRGTNGFRLMPTDEFNDAPATAEVTTAAGGHVIVLRYTWTHPDDGPQDGVLLAGSPDAENHAVTAAWGDSWHQHPAILTLAGTLDGGRLDLAADYGGGWRWTITVEGGGAAPTERAPARRAAMGSGGAAPSVEGGEPPCVTMHNVVPEEYATADGPAGPYPVMVAELRRES